MGEAYQLVLGQMILVALAEHTRRHLHTQRAYRLPAGGGATAWSGRGGEKVGERLLVGVGEERKSERGETG